MRRSILTIGVAMLSLLNLSAAEWSVECRIGDNDNGIKVTTDVNPAEIFSSGAEHFSKVSVAIPDPVTSKNTEYGNAYATKNGLRISKSGISLYNAIVFDLAEEFIAQPKEVRIDYLLKAPYSNATNKVVLCVNNDKVQCLDVDNDNAEIDWTGKAGYGTAIWRPKTKGSMNQLALGVYPESVGSKVNLECFIQKITVVYDENVPSLDQLDVTLPDYSKAINGRVYEVAPGPITIDAPGAHKIHLTVTDDNSNETVIDKEVVSNYLQWQINKLNTELAVNVKVTSLDGSASNEFNFKLTATEPNDETACKFIFVKEDGTKGQSWTQYSSTKKNLDWVSEDGTTTCATIATPNTANNTYPRITTTATAKGLLIQTSSPNRHNRGSYITVNAPDDKYADYIILETAWIYSDKKDGYTNPKIDGTVLRPYQETEDGSKLMYYYKFPEPTNSFVIESELPESWDLHATSEAMFNMNRIKNVKILFKDNNETDVSSMLDISNKNIIPEYYNLQGIKVQNPTHGIFIKVVGNERSKVVL